jgi:hypothetical protein
VIGSFVTVISSCAVAQDIRATLQNKPMAMARVRWNLGRWNSGVILSPNLQKPQIEARDSAWHGFIPKERYASMVRMPIG